MNANAHYFKFRNWPLAALLTFSFLICLAGYALIRQLSEINKIEVSNNLASIGQLKVNQIRSYLDERRGDAISLTNFLTVPAAHQWVMHSSGSEFPPSLKQPLERVIDINQYGGMLLLDGQAHLRMGIGRYTELSAAGKAMALGVLHDRTPMAFQIYFGDPSAPEKPLLDIFVPVLSADNSQVMGVLVLRDDLHLLYQLINTWPVQSKTAESLLVTRDGNDALFLNELRHKKNTALKLRTALNGDSNSPGWPAIRATQGYSGFLEAYDYWGKPVLAYTLPIPDSPWGMVVKIETDEAMAHISHLQTLAWIVIGILIVLMSLAAFLWHKKQNIEQQAFEKLNVLLEKLHKREIVLAEFKHTLDQVHDCIFMFDPDTLRFSYVNQGSVNQVGYSAEELLLMTPLDINPEFTEEYLHTMLHPLLNGSEPSLTFETVHEHKDGHRIPVEVLLQVVRQENRKLICVALVRDITERKQTAEVIHQLSFYDPLTQLPNRHQMCEYLRQSISDSAHSGEYGAVMFLDLDHFKEINDTKGHEVGDLLLIEVARRLKECVREGDMVARLGSNEFVVLLELLGDKQDEAAAYAKRVAGKIQVSINQSYLINGHTFYSTISIGINLFFNRQCVLDELLKRADAALYQAKAAGRNAICFFDPAMQALLEVRVQMEDDLRLAVGQSELRLYYQIQVGRLGVLGAEVLLRWEHPQRGLISPVEFIPLAEETGLIVPIGTWVLETACAQLKRWQSTHQAYELSLAVNVSAKQFHQADFVEVVRHALHESGANPAQLKLELTESLVLENIDDAIRKMQELKLLGIRFSMDDFGTGYSSLSYLKKLPLDQVKIDQSFVRDLPGDRHDAAIVQTIIAMAHALDLHVIAEGVETQEHLDFLHDNGCHSYQGYLFSKPVTLEEFEKLLDSTLFAQANCSNSACCGNLDSLARVQAMASSSEESSGISINEEAVMKMEEIRTLAKSHHIKTDKLSKAELIHKIQIDEGNFDCYATAHSGACDRIDCTWRDDCFDAARAMETA